MCSNCGSKVGQTARFCSRCGAPQRGAADVQEPSEFRAQRGFESWEVCEILWWRGYLKSDFYAWALGSDQREYEVGRSSQFFWRRPDPPPPDHERARTAHEALVERLVKGGWEPLGAATPWYAARFRRHATGLRVLTGDHALEALDEDGSGLP